MTSRSTFVTHASIGNISMKHLLLVLGLLTSAAPVLAAAPAQEQKIEELETRIKALEASAQVLRKQADDTMQALQAARGEIETLKQSQGGGAASEPAPVAAAAGANGNAFNPAMSVILNGQYAHHGAGAQGLSLGESEVS